MVLGTLVYRDCKGMPPSRSYKVLVVLGALVYRGSKGMPPSHSYGALLVVGRAPLARAGQALWEAL